MSNPKLALIPSGYKSGKVYSILPNDATGDFDFERQSIGTRVRKDGLIEEVTNDVPRLDWYNSNCPSLLLEPQRTNNLKYSEDFTNVVWSLLSGGTGTNPVVTANYSIAPNGTLTADRIIFNQGSGTSSSDFSIIRQIVTSVGQGISSVYMKSNTDDNYIIGIDEVGTGIKDVTVTNQWQRFEYSETTNDRLQLSLRGSSNSNYADISVWGAMLEQGSYPTSYIKTEASTVTRLKDECLNGGDSDLFDITEGSWFLDLVPYEISSSKEITLSDGTNSNRFLLQFQSNNTQVRLVVVSGGSIGVSLYEPITINTRNKILVTFKENEFKIYINGTLEGTDTSGNIPTGLDTFNFSNVSGSNNFEGKLYDTRVYDRVLTETEAIELTTL